MFLEEESTSSLPPVTIPEFFAGQDVFVTGATGFVGMLLVEKLLWSCPEIGNIYMLGRQRKGLSPQNRLEKLKKHVVFQRIRKYRPQALEKLRIIAGDQMEQGLGLKLEDRQLLKERINVVFHAAASVRFDDPLKKAVLCNTRGTLEMVNLALEMNNLKVFVYVSTAYSNCDYFHVEEKVYNPPMDWRSAISAAERLDHFQLDVITKRLLGRKPNTYVFSKSLAEAVVYDHKDLIPALIIRPSVVTPPIREPVPGYIANFNGPTGLMTGLLTGITIVALVDPDVAADHVTVDTVVVGIITAAWRRAHVPSNNLPVYNCCGHGCTKETTQGDMREMARSLSREVPLYPVYHQLSILTRNFLLFAVLFYGLQLPWTIFMDTLLRLSGKKPRLVSIQRRIFTAMMVLRMFSHNRWTFSTDSYEKLEKSLHPSDMNDFRIEIFETDPYPFLVKCVKGIREHIGEKTTLEQNAAMRNKLYWVHIALCLSACLLLYRFSVPYKLMCLMINITRKILIV